MRSYVNRLARFSSPDPAGRRAVNPSSPQSWNRYAYVTNNPMRMVDPLGLCTTQLYDAVAPAHGLHKRPRALVGCADAGGGDGGGGDSGAGGGDNGGGGELPLAGPTDYGNYCPDGCVNVAGPGSLGYIDNSPFLDGTIIGPNGAAVPCCQSYLTIFDNGPTFADQQMQGIAPGIVQGAGSIGDASTYLIWTGAALGVAAIPFAPELYSIGASGASSFSTNLLMWQTLDPVGFGEASDIIFNFLPTPPGITATGSGAVMGVLGSQLCDTTALVTRGSCQ
jgi:hypothetical protein